MAATATSNESKQLLNVQEAAEYIGVVKHTLDVWRITNRYSLPFIRVGKKIRYRKSDLEAWLESRRVAG